MQYIKTELQKEVYSVTNQSFCKLLKTKQNCVIVSSRERDYYAYPGYYTALHTAVSSNSVIAKLKVPRLL